MRFSLLNDTNMNIKKKYKKPTRPRHQLREREQFFVLILLHNFCSRLAIARVLSVRLAYLIHDMPLFYSLFQILYQLDSVSDSISEWALNKDANMNAVADDSNNFVAFHPPSHTHHSHRRHHRHRRIIINKIIADVDVDIVLYCRDRNASKQSVSQSNLFNVLLNVHHHFPIKW